MSVRLIDHLRSLGLDGRTAREALASGKVRVDGVPVADGGREVEPASISYSPSHPRLVPGRDPVLLHQDPALAVLYKPSGWLAVPAPHRSDTNMLAFAGKLLGGVLPVHRLDEGTSGLMMVARSLRAQELLKEMFEEHRLERRYLAIARGQVSPDLRTVRSHLQRDRGDRLRGSVPRGEEVPADAKEAITELRGLEPLQGATLVEARLQTGRTHQVRIHLAESGHPILGDPLYADAHSARHFPRLALHAAVLSFRHPLTGQELTFQAPLADDMESWRRDHPQRAPRRSR